ncbi:MAG: hypothetical protein COA38_12570 [Fluviicola sp.]|nr:MAG: hypothetical protein COA38_12570 [Fluviicola sp.]
MKSIFYIFAILITSGIYAQSNYVSNVMDNSYGEYVFLYELPWDQSQLIQIKKEVVQSPSFQLIYKFETISNGTSTPFNIPFCAEVSTEPLFLDDGILATGTTPLNGVECVFFDGINVIEFDLNQGNGDSDPFLTVVDDRVFIIANDGNVKQLYEYDQVAHTVTKITNGLIDVKNVCASFGNDVYYSVEYANVSAMQFEYNLYKASLNIGVYTYSNIHSVDIPFGPSRYFYWRNSVNKDGKVFLTQESISFTSGELSDLKVISIDQNDQVETVHQVLPTEKDELKLFEWDDAIWAYVYYQNELYKSTDGLSFTLNVDSGLKLITNHHVTENNKLFLDLYIPVSDIHEIAAHYGILQTIYTGDHLHFLLEDNGVVYFSDWIWYDSSSIVLIHTAFDVVEDIYIDQADHSPVHNASLVHNGEFTFLFSYAFADIDVLKLTGSPSAGVNELSIDFSAYPNPLSSGESLFLRTDIDGVGEILTADGKVIKQLNLSHGTNVIETSSLSRGVYFVSFMNHTHRIVVN